MGKAQIFRESVLKDRFETGQFKGRLLGDSDYELSPYLFTPISNPFDEREERYNRAHISTRNTIERCFRLWKRRFQCLQHSLPVSLQNSKNVIAALAVLHNIAIDQGDDEPPPGNFAIFIKIL